MIFYVICRFIFPATFYLKLMKKKNLLMYWCAIFAIILGTLSFITAITGSIINM